MTRLVATWAGADPGAQQLAACVLGCCLLVPHGWYMSADVVFTNCMGLIIKQSSVTGTVLADGRLNAQSDLFWHAEKLWLRHS